MNGNSGRSGSVPVENKKLKSGNRPNADAVPPAVAHSTIVREELIVRKTAPRPRNDQDGISVRRLNHGNPVKSSIPDVVKTPVYPPQPVFKQVAKKVQVVYTYTPEDFYCQLEEDFDLFDALMVQLRETYDGLFCLIVSIFILVI